MSVAAELAGLSRAVLGQNLPVKLIAWDGSEAGPETGPALVITTPKALRRLMWQPNELGLAQAYLLGEIDVIGDLGKAFQLAGRPAKPKAMALAKAIPAALRHRVLGPRPAAPAMQAALDGDLHSQDRDRAAISYHYDLSNEFYELLLDEHMAYSCGYWTSDAPDYTLADAQRDKLDLIGRKLGLRPGMRLLDVGCGWGSLSVYAAKTFGVKVTGVTLSAQQHAYATARVAREGLTGLAEIRLMDYRDIKDGPYDAAATIEMGEHVGEQGYPAFAQQLHDLLKPGGRLLVQQMSRGHVSPGGGAFIESYIAPDMHMRPVGQTVAMIEQSGLEVRNVHAMREHYVKTVGVWHATLERRWAEVVELIGEPAARIWRLYLVGGARAFATNRMGVDQILAVRPGSDGVSGMPATNDWETA
jgi:cyclopropane-fatty-acyl-phospholipid synthase